MSTDPTTMSGVVGTFTEEYYEWRGHLLDVDVTITEGIDGVGAEDVDVRLRVWVGPTPEHSKEIGTLPVVGEVLEAFLSDELIPMYEALEDALVARSEQEEWY